MTSEKTNNISELSGAIGIKEDAVIVPDFMQTVLKFDPGEVFSDLRKVPKFDPGDQQDFPMVPFKPHEARLIMGDYHALRYRGNALNRHKVWWQDDISKGYRKYYYTGWQQMIATAQCDTTAMPKSVQGLMAKLNEYLDEQEEDMMNHGIYTFYRNGEDSIGRHSDKLPTIKDNSWIVVLKLGEPRLFEITSLEGKVLFCEKLSPGTAVFMRSDTANATTKHAVPVTEEKTGASGSVVFRNITESVAWPVQQRRAERAREAKFKLRASKDK